jgi:branched-chain amino acid aminotransferase
MSFDFKQSTAFFDDAFVPFDTAKLSIASSPVLYGLSIYSVFGVRYHTDKTLRIFRLKDHYNRLMQSAQIMDFHQFTSEWMFEKFEKTMLELLSKNDVHENVLIRVTVYIDELIAGTKIHGLKNSVSAYVYPMGEILRRSGIHACVSSWQRTPDNSIPSRAKVNGSYVNASLMKNEAILNGYDEAIAIDEHGHVSEGTVANLFIVRNGQLITPDASTDILEGITRNSLITIAQDIGLDVTERTIDRTELYIADEAFMCGSSANLTPLLSIDKRQIGAGKIGPITKRLSDAYEQCQLGLNAQHSDWVQTV